jgi:hypothetical protein
MTKADAKVLGYSATLSRASWWFSASSFPDAGPKSRPTAGHRAQLTGIITVSPVSKEPAPLEQSSVETDPSRGSEATGLTDPTPSRASVCSGRVAGNSRSVDN